MRFGYSNICSSFFNSRKKKRSFIWFYSYYIIGSNFHRFNLLFTFFFNLVSWGSPNNYSTLKTITRIGEKPIYLDKAFNSISKRSGALGRTPFTVPLPFSLVSSKRWLSMESVKIKETELCPYWVTGFADAESCFSLKMAKKIA